MTVSAMLLSAPLVSSKDLVCLRICTPAWNLRSLAQRRDRSISSPPTSGPTAPDTPISPDHRPTPRPRSALRRLASMMARLPGVNSAPPIPWSSRAPIRASTLGATAQAREATANQTTPIR